MKRFSIKLTAGRALIGFYLALTAVLTYNMFPIIEITNQSIERYHDIFDHATKKLELLQNLRKNMNSIQNAVFRHVVGYSDEVMQFQKKRLDAAIAENQEVIDRYQKLITDSAEQAILNLVIEKRTVNARVRSHIISLSAQHQRDKAIVYYVTVQENTQLEYSNAINQLLQFNLSETYNRITATENYIRTKRKSINILLGISSIFVFLTGIMVLFTNRELNLQNIQLAASMHEYEEMVENSDEMIAAINTDGIITWANRSWKAVTLYNDDDIKNGIHLTSLLAETSKHIYQERFPKALRGERTERTEAAITAKDGSLRYLNGKSIPIKVNGKVTGLQTFAHNITERKIAEQKLHDTSVQLQHVLNIFDQSFWGFDVTNDKMIYVSPGNEKVFGYPEKDFLNDSKLWFNTIIDEDKPKFGDVWAFLHQGRSVLVEFRINHPEKGIRWIESRMAPTLNDNHKLIRLDGIAIDITDRKQTAENLEMHVTELEKTNSELDTFVYSISHDLRSPLLATQGLINLAAMHLDSKTQMQQYLSLMEIAITQMDNTIKDILDYSRNARLELIPEQIDMNQMVSEVYEGIRHMTGAEKIKFSSDIKNHIPFFSDRQRMKTLIVNLLGNAFKYSRASEPDPFVKLSFVSAETDCILTVEDNGEGIPDAWKTKIFDMFVRASDKSEGTGLGLYICKEIVTKMKGTIRVTSESGKGSIFTVRIPNLLKPQKDVS